MSLTHILGSVVIYTPNGAIRVVERINGVAKVRTIFGGKAYNNALIALKWEAGMKGSKLRRLGSKLK